VVEAGVRKAKIEIRKAERKSRGSGGATIPPLRNGKRRRCYGRDDSIEKGPTRQKAARKKSRAAPVPSAPLRAGGMTVTMGHGERECLGGGIEIVKAAPRRPSNHIRASPSRLRASRTPKLGMGIEVFAEEGGGVFAELAVVRAEGGQEVGVDIEFASNFAVTEDGDYDFGFGLEGTG
jgi:hypothetical protein